MSARNGRLAAWRGSSTSHYGSALARSVPVGVALFPVGLLFGILADQAGWRAHEILIMSLVGFTGSGQFALLIFMQEGLGLALIFLIILCMNLRYVPMALSASRPLKLRLLPKFLMSHYVSDESYAAEAQQDTVSQRGLIRLVILFFWTGSTVLGVIAAGFVPPAVETRVVGLTFPISALLFLLSAMNIVGFVRQGASVLAARLTAVTASVLAVSVLMWLFGPRYFWIPGIAAAFIMLSSAQRKAA